MYLGLGEGARTYLCFIEELDRDADRAGELAHGGGGGVWEGKNERGRNSIRMYY